MIRKERNNKKGRQPLPADCDGRYPNREAASYTDSLTVAFFGSQSGGIAKSYHNFTQRRVKHR
jgi:hypothetical protein